MEKKPVSQKSNEEILRQQLELLAEHSRQTVCHEELAVLTDAMVKVYDRLKFFKHSSIQIKPVEVSEQFKEKVQAMLDTEYTTVTDEKPNLLKPKTI